MQMRSQFGEALIDKNVCRTLERWLDRGRDIHKFSMRLENNGGAKDILATAIIS